MKKRLFLILILVLLSSCSKTTDSINYPDCGIVDDHMNNEMKIFATSSLYNLYQSIDIQIRNNAGNTLISNSIDFEILIYKKDTKKNEWIEIANSTHYYGEDKIAIKENSKTFFSFSPDLLNIDKRTEIFICLFAKNTETGENVGSSYNFFLTK